MLWPEKDGELSAFLQRLTNTHTPRWQRAKRKVGYGHVYQGRFKSFPGETDEHFYTVVRYVERNALRANLVERAEAWRGGGEVSGGESTRSAARCSFRGRYPNLATGWKSSISHKRKPKWPPSVVAFNEAVRTAATTGRNVSFAPSPWATTIAGPGVTSPGTYQALTEISESCSTPIAFTTDRRLT